MNLEFWQQQKPDGPLFPDVQWSKPEQKSKRGKLLIVGGSPHGFMAVGKSFTVASQAGTGQVKVALPDVMKKSMPPTFSEGIFLPTNPSGGFSKDGLTELLAAIDWADGVLLIGDSGQNSETAILFENLLSKSDKWFTIARDAVDLLREPSEFIANRPRTHLVMTFAQTQKLFQTVLYPKVLTFSMQLSSFVEALHKFTITYPVTLTIFHQENIVMAHDGQVISQKFSDSFSFIDGTTATKSASYLLWNQEKPLEAIASSLQI